MNTVNCVGVMGAGIAYEFRLRYPEMYSRYKQLCQENLIQIGSLWIYKATDKWILNFPTKKHWRYPSKPEYLELGLKKFVETYRAKGIKSVAFPLLGASHGGLSKDLSIDIMVSHLNRCEIPVEIWHYDPFAYDDLYVKFRESWMLETDSELSRNSKLRVDFVRKMRQALCREDIRSLSGLLKVEGIGEKTLEKAFNCALNEDSSQGRLSFDDSSE